MAHGQKKVRNTLANSAQPTPYGQKTPNACRHRVWATGLRAGRLGCALRALRLPELAVNSVVLI